jgi:hypothetical protein
MFAHHEIQLASMNGVFLITDPTESASWEPLPFGDDHEKELVGSKAGRSYEQGDDLSSTRFHA